MPKDPVLQNRRRWATWHRILVVMLPLLVIAWLARGALLGPLVARLAAAALADATHGHAVIAHATGGWVNDARFSDVQVAAPGWTVEVQQLDARYGMRLLRGDLAALHQLTIAGLNVAITTDTKPSADTSPPWPGLLAQLPPTLPNLRVAGQVVITDGDIETRLEGLDLQVDGDQVKLAITRIRTGSLDLSLPACVLQRNDRDTLTLIRPLSIDLPHGLPHVQVETLQLTLGNAIQQLEADGRIAGGTWHATMSVETMRIALTGVDLARIAGWPAIIGPVPVDAVVERIADGWAIRSLHVTSDGMTLQAQAELHPQPWRTDAVHADLVIDLARVRHLLPGMPEAGGLLHLALQGSAQLHPLDLRQGDLRLSIDGTEVVWGGEPCAPLRLALQMTTGVIQVQDLTAGWRGYAATLADPDGAASAPAGAEGWLLLPRPIHVAGGTLRIAAQGDTQGNLKGDVQLSGLPLTGLPVLAALRYLTGTVDGQILLAGTIREPTWSASLAVSGLEAKFSPDVPTLTGGQAHLGFANGILTVEDMHGDLGGSTVHVTGQVAIDGGEHALDLHGRGSNLLVVQRSDARVRADLDLNLHGSLSAPTLSGSVVISNALITPELHMIGDSAASAPADDRILLFEMPDPPLSDLRFDVRVTSSPTTEQSPDRGLRVATRWGRGACDLDLHLGGTGIAPTPQGRVSIRNGVVTLPFSTLTVTHGELVFPSDDPFQPRIAVSAGARIRQYDVQVQVSGTLNEPMTRISGSGLDEQEALLLLTTGSTPRELQSEQGQKAAMGRVGSWLGQEAWRELDGPGDPDAGPSLSDRVNIEWGRSVSIQGRDTIDSEFELTTPGSQPALLLYGQRDRYDQYNAGLLLRFYWGGDEP